MMKTIKIFVEILVTYYVGRAFKSREANWDWTEKKRNWMICLLSGELKFKVFRKCDKNENLILD